MSRPREAFAPIGWDERAACRNTDPDLFFPVESELGSEADAPEEAVAICSICQVRSECLGYALENRVRGVWAGTTMTQRNEIRVELGIRPVPV